MNKPNTDRKIVYDLICGILKKKVKYTEIGNKTVVVEGRVGGGIGRCRSKNQICRMDEKVAGI